MPNKLYSNPCNRCLMSCGFLHQIVPQSTIETYLTRCCSTHLGMLGEGESDCWDTIDYERTPLHSTVLRLWRNSQRVRNMCFDQQHSATIYSTANSWFCRLDPTISTASHSPTPSPLFPCRLQLGSTLASPQWRVVGALFSLWLVDGW